MSERECYSILGVKKNDTDEDINKAYKKLAKQYHPDFSKGGDTTEKFKQVCEAYNTVMSIRHNRQNRLLRIKRMFVRPSTDTHGPDEVHIPERGSDIYLDVDVGFEESLRGCKKMLPVTRNTICECCTNGIPDETCLKCNGTGKYKQKKIIEVKIPVAVKDKQVLRIRGKGNLGGYSGENGDLVIKVHVPKSKRYVVKGRDIYVRIGITFPEAVLGTVKNVYTIYGDVECKIPRGIQSGTKVCIDGKGIMLDGKIGNEYVSVNVVTPQIDDETDCMNVLRAVQRLYMRKPPTDNTTTDKGE